MSSHEPPGSGPTEPIRPTQEGREPIPERVRQPIVVPHRESTIAGLPRPLALAAAAALVVALLLGFLLGRSTADPPAPIAGAGRRAACQRALTLALQVGELRTRALANRQQAMEAVALGFDARIDDLDAELEALLAAVDESDAQLQALVQRCHAGGTRKGGRGEQNPRTRQG